MLQGAVAAPSARGLAQQAAEKLLDRAFRGAASGGLVVGAGNLQGDLVDSGEQDMGEDVRVFVLEGTGVRGGRRRPLTPLYGLWSIRIPARGRTRCCREQPGVR
jgi:hypothetical protein